MDARSLLGGSGHTLAFGASGGYLLSLVFPRRLALKFEGQVFSAAAPINLIQTNIVASYRPSKVTFQMIRATRVQRVAVFVLRCGVKLCIQSLIERANHNTRISNPTLRLAIPVMRSQCRQGMSIFSAARNPAQIGLFDVPGFGHVH